MPALGKCFAICVFSVVSVYGQVKPATVTSNTAAGKSRPEVAAPKDETRNSPESKLPVRRVVLYKNGVGFFEHLGPVHGNQDVHIDFTSAQLNDALKSLTVLDLSGGRITGVDYNSEAPLARRLATLRLALGERPTQADFLSALRGAHIEVRDGAKPPVTGKLLSIERKTRSSTTFTVETEEISLVTDDGQVRSVDLTPATAVRILDNDLRLEIGKYLGLVASARDQDVRRMTVSTAGSGDRNLYVSYISEVPIWKTTYRIVLPSKSGKKPLLQGWAIIDNTVGEDWNNVELSLVAGAPHSFIQQLSEPYYSRRPVVPLPESVQLSPQTHAATLVGGNAYLTGVITDASGAVVPNASVRLLDEKGTLVATTSSDSLGNYTFSNLARGNYQVESTAQGFKRERITNFSMQAGKNQVNSTLQVGGATETVEVSSGAVMMNSDVAETVNSEKVMSLPGVANRPHKATGYALNGRVGSFVGGVPGGVAGGSMGGVIGGVGDARDASLTAAIGQELGDLFEYKLKDHVTLKKNQSALVPIAQTDIEAEKVSLWSNKSGSGRPLRAIWVKNTSPLTLDGGSFSVLENEVFAGEGLTDPLKPGERRLLSYATDLGLLVDAQHSSRPERVTRVIIRKGSLTQISELHENTLYTVRNQNDAPTTLVIEHAFTPGATLAKGTKEPEERAPGSYRFKLDIPAKTSASLPVEEVRVTQQMYMLTNLTDDQVAVFAKDGSLSPEMVEALRKIAAQKAIVAKLEDEMENRQNDIDRIVADQSRLRENMKALKGSAEEKALLQRYTRELDDQETKLDTLRSTIQKTEEQRDKADEELDQMIENLDLQATF